MIRRVMVGLLGGIVALGGLLLLTRGEWFIGPLTVGIGGTLLGYAFGFLKGEAIEQQIWGKRARGSTPSIENSRE